MLESLGIEEKEDIQAILSTVAAIADYFNQGMLVEIAEKLREKADALREGDAMCDLYAAAALDDEAHELEVERTLMSERDDDVSEEELDAVMGDV